MRLKCSSPLLSDLAKRFWRAVEAVDLIAEQDRAPPFVLEAVLGRLDDLAHPADPFRHRRERLEVTRGVARDDARQRRLTGARGAPEDARADVAAADQLAERLPGPEEMLLAEELLEGPRAHARGEGLGGAGEEGRVRHGKREVGN